MVEKASVPNGGRGAADRINLDDASEYLGALGDEAARLARHNHLDVAAALFAAAAAAARRHGPSDE